MRTALRRVRALFTWQVAGPVVAYALAALLVGGVVEAFVARQQAFESQQANRIVATRRIDALQAQINTLQDRLRHTSVQDAAERGRLEESIRVLAEQIRHMGGQPVETGEPAPSRSNAASSSPSPRSSSSARPSPTTHPTPQPSPTPTRTCIAVICIKEPA